MKDASVEFQPFEALQDVLAERNITPELFLEETIWCHNKRSDEDWRSQYDAT